MWLNCGRRFKTFFTDNVGSVDSVATVWEAFKVTIRGLCLAQQHRMLRTLRADLARLEAEIGDLERRYADTPQPDHLASLRANLTEYQEAAMRECKFQGKHHVARTYTEESRPGRSLALRLKPPRANNDILEIHSPGGQIHYDTDGIMGEFLAFYRCLYSTSHPVSDLQTNI